MKQPWEWNEADILELISNGVQESLSLDYKACASLGRTDGKKKELSKDVSAFANSAGGTIVYGVIENGHVPTNIDSGYDPADITKEWLEQVINSTIERRIDGIRITQVALITTQPGKVLYVVSIPQSNHAPHMASGNRFYKRFNFESVLMEEYEVRDVARRSETPNLQLILYFPSGNQVPLQFEPSASESAPIGLGMSITNESPEPAQHILIFLHLDKRLKVKYSSGMTVQGDSEVQDGSQVVPVTVLQMNWSVPGKMPVWEGTQFRVTDTPIQFSVPNFPDERYHVSWEIKAPRMIPKRGFYSLISSGGSAWLRDRSQ
jgi:hypothetical protein